MQEDRIDLADYKMDLTLRVLNENDEAAFFKGQQEWVGESPHWYSFAWKEGMTFQSMLEILRAETQGLNLQAGRVPHTMLYGFVNGNIIGRVSVRHTLNDQLRRRGGHMGYAVAPRFRRQGYASEMVRQALEYCRSINLSEIMITCGDANIPSWKIIEKLGGRLQDRVWDDEDQETIRRYWLTL